MAERAVGMVNRDDLAAFRADLFPPQQRRTGRAGGAILLWLLLPRFCPLRFFPGRLRDAGAGARWRPKPRVTKRGGPKTASSSSSETACGSGTGTTMRALQCGHKPAFPANSFFTCNSCPLGQVTLIDIHHLVKRTPQEGQIQTVRSAACPERHLVRLTLSLE